MDNIKWTKKIYIYYIYKIYINGVTQEMRENKTEKYLKRQKPRFFFLIVKYIQLQIQETRELQEGQN